MLWFPSPFRREEKGSADRVDQAPQLAYFFMGQRTVVVHGTTIEGHERVNLRTVESGCQVVQPGRGGKREVMNRIDPPEKVLQQTGFDGGLTPATDKEPRSTDSRRTASCKDRPRGEASRGPSRTAAAICIASILSFGPPTGAAAA